MAFCVEHLSISFAARALVYLSSSSTVSIGLVAVCSVVAEALVLGAVLPTDWTDTSEAILAVRVA